MHTGYDNFWMHKNGRPKPVLNLPKNDNYSCALLTDNYKYMQSGGCPSHLSSFMPPQNNAASSHEKDHYRNYQSMWSSSIYSLPFMPSYANNLHPQDPFFSQTDNFVYSSPNPQPQEKHEFRHLEMSNGNVNILTRHNTNTSTLANNGLAHAQNNKDTNTQIPRIRVKDVFSLNNKGVQGQLGLEGHFGIRHQKELLECAANCNRVLESQAQTEYIKYKNTNLVELSRSSSHFEHRTAKETCLNKQEQFQNSCSFYQQIDGFSLGNFEFSGGRQIESGLSSESFQSSTPASLLSRSQFLTQESILERELQNCQVNAGGYGGEKVTPKRNIAELLNADHSDSDYSRSCGLNERTPENCTNLRNVTNLHGDLQENLPRINELNLKSRNSASNIMTKNAPSKSPPLKAINNQQNCFIKISIPYTGKSSFIRLNDHKPSAVSLQSVFEQDDQICALDRITHIINDEENEFLNSTPPPVGQSSFISHHTSPEATSIHDGSASLGGTITNKSSIPAVSTSLTSSPRNRQEDTINLRLHRQEFDDSSNKDYDIFQNSIRAPEIIQQKFAVKISRGDDSTAEQGIPNNDFAATPLTLKQESPHPEIETASLQLVQNPPGGKDFHPSIKTEDNSENLTMRECELGLQPPDVGNEAVVKFHVEGCSLANKSANDSVPVTDSEDHVDKVITLKNSSSKRGEVRKSEEKKRGREISLSRVNYKSNINRDKLDLLIQFLKKDQDSDGSSSCKERLSCGETASNVNSNSYRSRRKLSKASVVKNKNNSREMISLMSPKGSIFTSKAPQITERSKNLDKTEDRKSSWSKDKVMTEESVDVSEERLKCSSPCQEKESKKDDSWVAESSNEVECLRQQQFQEFSEKLVPKDKCTAREENAIISTVRAFENSKTHFCMRCNLVSSTESFWINVVSGKVRCLNCFKRMTSKAKGSVLKSKSDLHDSSVKPLQKRKSKTEKVNKSQDSGTLGFNCWDKGGSKRSSKCEVALRKLNGLKENVRQELLELFLSEKGQSNEKKETTNCPCRKRRRSSSGEGVDSQRGKPLEEKVLKTEKSACNGSSGEELVGRGLSENCTSQEVKDINAKRKRKSSSGEEDFAKSERHTSSIKQGKTSIPKEQYSEDGGKEKTVIKSEKSQDRRASRCEEGSENRTKKETKGEASSNTAEETKCHRVSVNEERGKKDLKVRHCTDESRKPLPREGCPARKNHSAEEATNRSPRQETSLKSSIQNIWREGRDHQRSNTSKLFGRRDPNAPDASARRSTSNQTGLENQKRTESTEQPRNEDFSPRKVHTLQEFVKRNSIQATHPSKSSEAKASKESDNSQKGDLRNARISAKSERSNASKDEGFVSGEHLRKDAKPPPEGEKAKVKDLWKGLVASQTAKPSEPAKGKATGFVEQPRRKSRDEQRGSQKTVDSRRPSDEESAVPKVSAEKNSEDKEGTRSENMPKVSTGLESSISTQKMDNRGSRTMRRDFSRISRTTEAPYGNRRQGRHEPRKMRTAKAGPRPSRASAVTLVSRPSGPWTD